VQFYKQAIDVDPTSELATYCRLKQISILEHSGKDDEASQLIRDLDAVRKGGPPFAGKALLDENVVAAKVELLVQKAEYDQAVKYCKKYYESFPDSRDVLLHYAEKVPFALRKERKYEEAIAWYEKLLKDFSSAKDNSIFYSNYITALSYCRTECDQTQLERIRKAIEEFAKNFPDNRNVSVFYAAYADVCRTIGQDEVAQEYYKRALAHPGVTEEMKQAIGQMIATIGADRIRRKNNVLEEAAARTSYFKSIFIWLNVCVVIVIALILFRRWSVRK
jgi:tetratricopeptide (TPR) repeat protein